MTMTTTDGPTTTTTTTTAAPVTPEILQNEIDWLRGIIDAKPSNVIAAIAAVMRDVEGIDKGMKSEQGYRYRGIEQITAAIQPLLGRHGIVFVPRVTSRFTKDISINNKPWTEEQLTIEYTVYGPGGKDDFIVVGPVFGFGRDNSDKGANKAMSQAFKYALLQTFCIGDAKDDGDKETHATDATHEPLTPSQILASKIADLDGEEKRLLGLFCDTNDIPRVPKKMTEEQIGAAIAYLDGLATTPGPEPQDAPEPPTTTSEAVEPEQAPQTAVEAPTPPSDARHRGEAAIEPTEADLEGASPKLINDAITEVLAMRAHDVDKELTFRGLHTEGELDARKHRLALAKIRDAKAATEA